MENKLDGIGFGSGHTMRDGSWSLTGYNLRCGMRAGWLLWDGMGAGLKISPAKSSYIWFLALLEYSSLFLEI